MPAYVGQLFSAEIIGWLSFLSIHKNEVNKFNNWLGVNVIY